MKLSDGKYICPFCVSSWDCDGPHIKEEELVNYYERINYIKEDLALIAQETVSDYAAKNNWDLSELEKLVYLNVVKRTA